MDAPGSAPTTDAGITNEQLAVLWSRLIGYYLSCLEHEDGFEELLQRSDSGNRYVFPTGTRERLFTDPTSGLEVDRKIASILESACLRGEALFYGYPVFLFEDTTGGTKRRKLGCLLVTELGPLPKPGEPLPGRLFLKHDEPFFHPTLFSKLGVKNDQQALLAKELPPEKALGSAQSVALYLRDLLEALELSGSAPIDPLRLAGENEGNIDGFGVHNAAIVFRGASSDYNRRLLEELRFLQSQGVELARTAAQQLVVRHSSSWKLEADSQVEILCPIPANDAQMAALRSGLAEALTVVTGPPGTGKSQLITNLIASAWASDMSVLVVSTNNQAVDVACGRAQKIHPGMVIRTGSKEHREKAKETLIDLLANRTARPDHRAVIASLEVGRQRYKTARTNLDDRTTAETRLAEVILGQEPLQALASWPTQNQIESPVRAALIKRRLRRVKRVMGATVFRQWTIRRLSRQLGVDLSQYGQVVQRYLELDIERVDLRRKIRSFPESGSIVREVVEAEHQLQEASAAAVRAKVDIGVASARTAINLFVQARTTWNHNGLAIAFPNVLQHVKAWATTAQSVAATLPLKARLFDLVVIDEASQCSIPHIIPLLFRAKRAIVVGDAQQLNHISTISRSDERTKSATAGFDLDDLSKQKLSYSRHSLFDAMAASAGTVRVLDEHYRSHPQIIGISNKIFYGGQLTILTDPQNLTDFGPHAIAWQDVSEKAWRPETGSAINQGEAAAVSKAVADLIRHKPGVSIGVVTPFSAQARVIQNLLESNIAAADRLRASLTVGTAHRFQGDERDVMVFSPVASDGLSVPTLRWLIGTPNLFNVAVTRARSYFLIVGNWRFCSQLEGPLGELARYVREQEVSQAIGSAGGAGRLHSEAEQRLFEALLRAGLPAEPKALIRGYECDFVIRNGTAVVNIECDGRHHYDAAGRLRLQDHARDALIRHQGWKVMRVPAWRCLSDPDGTVADIRSFLIPGSATAT